MLSYCSNCRKNTESKNAKVVRTENGKIMLCAVQCVIVKNLNLLKSKKLKDY